MGRDGKEGDTQKATANAMLSFISNSRMVDHSKKSLCALLASDGSDQPSDSMAIWDKLRLSEAPSESPAQSS